MAQKSPINLLNKNTCTHQDKKCNHLTPFSMLELYGKKKFTKEEKKENLRKYKLSCSNQGGEYTQCCDKNDKNIGDVAKKLKLPKLKGKIEYDRHGKLTSIKLCKGDKCNKDYKPLSNYEMCKLGSDYHKNEEKGEIKKFNQDCFLTQCNPQEKLPNILGTISENYTYEMDNQMSNAIQKNDLPLIKHYIQKDPSLKVRILTHNQEGNTIFHETLKYNSGNNLYYIFKLAGKGIAFKENMEGNTILHIAMGKDNKNAIMFCIKLGCDINEKNNEGDTPIFYAIRNNLKDNIRTAINHLASLEIKNKLGNTPLFEALNMKTKSVDIVRLLIERGSSTKEKNKAGMDALGIINSIKKPTQEDEEVRTFLEQVRMKNLGIGFGNNELSIEETRKLKGIAYELTGEDRLNGKETDFKINIEYTDQTDQSDQTDKNVNYYPDDLEEKHMQPHKPGVNNFSHEPYFSKFKNLQKDKLKVLKDTILLTKWDNKNNRDKKLKIIDDIMGGKVNFDSYKYEVMNDNGITIDQEHTLFNDHSPTPIDSETITLQVRGPSETPYNIFKGENEELLNMLPDTHIIAPSQSLDEEIVKNNYHPLESPAFLNNNLEELDKDLFDLILEFINNNSTTLLLLAIIITFGIIVYIYMKSNKKNYFSYLKN